MQSLMPEKQVTSETERYSFLQLTKRFVFGRQKGASQRSNPSFRDCLGGLISVSELFMAERSEVVNNSAAGENSASGRPASARSRSLKGYLKTVNRRLPGDPEALATTSNRTTPSRRPLYQRDGWQGKATTRTETKECP